MPLNVEKSGEQDKGQSKEWSVNTDPGLSRIGHLVWKLILPANHKQSCKQILGESFSDEMLHQKAIFLFFFFTWLRSLESTVLCKILFLKESEILIPVGG